MNARYKPYDHEQLYYIQINPEEIRMQNPIVAVIDDYINAHVEIEWYREKRHNHDTGAPAYDPRILLKIVLLAYSRRINSSRTIMHACRENIVFRALSADSSL